MFFSEFISLSYKELYRESLFIVNFILIILFYLKYVLNLFIFFVMSIEFKKNCFFCGNFYFKNLDFISSMSCYMLQYFKVFNSEKELKKLCDNSLLDMYDGRKERESDVQCYFNCLFIEFENMFFWLKFFVVFIKILVIGFLI